MTHQAKGFDFCVVGAGRMGASIAGHLALQGARVAVFDRSDFDRCAKERLCHTDTLVAAPHICPCSTAPVCDCDNSAAISWNAWNTAGKRDMKLCVPT
jgi:ketopantoate reductase